MMVVFIFRPFQNFYKAFNILKKKSINIILNSSFRGLMMNAWPTCVPHSHLLGSVGVDVHEGVVRLINYLPATL